MAQVCAPWCTQGQCNHVDGQAFITKGWLPLPSFEPFLLARTPMHCRCWSVDEIEQSREKEASAESFFRGAARESARHR